MSTEKGSSSLTEYSFYNHHQKFTPSH